MEGRCGGTAGNDGIAVGSADGSAEREKAVSGVCIRPSTDMADMGRRIIEDGRKNDHCTADPIFLVEARKRIYGIDADYDPKIEWQHGDEYTALDEADAEAAEKFFQSHGEVPLFVWDGIAYGEGHSSSDFGDGEYFSDLKRLGYFEQWEFVQPFFTEQAAKHFIATNSHNYRKGLRVYVGSAYRNWEWQAVRDHLVSAAKTEEGKAKL